MKLQEIRAYQALDEIGDFDSKVNIIHTEIPKTFINKKEYALVFPKFIIKYNKDKNVLVSFSGVITPKRKRFLDEICRRYSKDGQVIIKGSRNGRTEIIKENDYVYFDILGRSKFVACPDGDFIWSYRFFEAILCGAIPVVQNISTLFSGYKYYIIGDKLDYNEKWVEQNLKKVKKEMML